MPNAIDPTRTLSPAAALAGADPMLRAEVLDAAAERRDLTWGKTVTYSPKVFLPLTNLCPDRCRYCSFRRSPDDPGAWTMTPQEVTRACEIGKEQGCIEALFCLGDRPERAWESYREQLADWGHRDTIDYLERAGSIALAHGLLPHTNAGLLTADEMERLRRVNVSLGLMLETATDRLCGPGQVHQHAPDKRPSRRLAMLDAGGELHIPFTTGILVGIGETMAERVESLLAIRDVHRRHGHIQEVIIQNFRAGEGTPMASAPEPDLDTLVHTIGLARLILDDEVSLQAPPNLSPGGIGPLLAAGINDLGGISPITPDYVNPGHPWPHIERLSETCARTGFVLQPRLPIYPHQVERPRALHADLRSRLGGVSQRTGPGKHGIPSTHIAGYRS